MPFELFNEAQLFSEPVPTTKDLLENNVFNPFCWSRNMCCPSSPSTSTNFISCLDSPFSPSQHAVSVNDGTTSSTRSELGCRPSCELHATSNNSISNNRAGLTPRLGKNCNGYTKPDPINTEQRRRNVFQSASRGREKEILSQEEEEEEARSSAVTAIQKQRANFFHEGEELFEQLRELFNLGVCIGIFPRDADFDHLLSTTEKRFLTLEFPSSQALSDLSGNDIY